MKRRTANRRGFTLVELLVTVVIITILASLVSVAAQSGLKMARKTEEIAGLRTLIQIYQSAAADNGGRYLAGYDRTVTEVSLPDGRLVSGPTANRYPYRLAEFLGQPVEDLILVGKNKGQVDTSSEYTVSLYPAFGINHYFVGGNKHPDHSIDFAADCISTVGQASTSPLVFATSGSESEGGETVHGFHTIEPPNLTGANWSSSQWTDSSKPDDYGHVHARYNGKVIAAFLDGSVREKTVEELRDMRLWSKRARERNDPDYTLTRSSGSPGGGRPRL